MEPVLAFLWSFAAIVVINLMLSGDNAIVIALAARNLPQRLQRRAIMFGTVGAVAVRIAMTLAVVWLLEIPGLLFVGGVALVWIGYKLLLPDGEGSPEGHLGKAKGIWGAIRTIVVADMVMGVDNVLGVAGAAHGSYALVVLGLVTSVPIVVWGSTWLLKWVERYPVIVYVGSAVLLCTAAKMIASEPLAQEAASHPAIVALLYGFVVFGVLWAGFVRNHRHLESRIHARLAQLAARLSSPDSPEGDGSMNVVLVPVSDLPNSHPAVHRVVEEFVSNPALQVHLLNVRRPLSSRVSRFVRRSLREDYHRERADLALAPARAILARHKVPFKVHIHVGDAATVITHEAKALGCDHILMSTARKGSITRILEDSTTERVLSLTTVPVELVVGDAVSPWERYGVPAAVGAALLGLVALIVTD
ncbi:MAG TPA: YjbE family putative metal transport protein [Usitatibacter sp.]|nr:YjbE family putative metal transport protein [Usitatibacter sp.]